MTDSSATPMVFMVHGLQFRTRGRSNAEKADYCDEEDLHFNAPGTLEDIRKMWPLTGSYTMFVERWRLKTWQDWLMQMNQYVAKAYGIHRHDLLRKWVNHYGVSLCFADDDKLEGIDLDAPEIPDDEPEEATMNKPDLDEIRKRAEHEVEEKDTPGGIAHFGIKKFFEGSIYDSEVGPVLKKRIQDFIHQSIMESHRREGTRQLRQDLKDLLAHVDVLEAGMDCFKHMDLDGERQAINAPEDPEVLALCERLGYGAVMDSAARQYRRYDSIGAFMVGPCVGFAKRIRAALEAIKEPVDEQA